MATRQPEYVVDADYSDDDDDFDGPSDPPEVIARRQVRIYLALWLPGSRVRGVLALPILLASCEACFSRPLFPRS